MRVSTEVEHDFGGGWTEVKLNAVADYLQFYTRALQAQPAPDTPFETWYIDAFAGTGERTVGALALNHVDQTGDIFEKVRLQGSARRAIAVDPPFCHYVFIEKDAKRYSALQRVRAEYPTFDIQCLHGDANTELRNVFSNGPWQQPGRSGLQRGVVFLDPYGMSVRWETLRFLANTKRVDIWYLFPLHATLRQLSHDYGAIDQSKRNALLEIFGTADWEREFYKRREAPAEPRRVCRRPQLLRGRGYDEQDDEQVLT
jgi:three-Cys-motif partner protein